MFGIGRVPGLIFSTKPLVRAIRREQLSAVCCRASASVRIAPSLRKHSLSNMAVTGLTWEMQMVRSL